MQTPASPARRPWVRFARFTLMGVAVTLIATALRAAESTPPWQAGAASAVITPKEFLWLGGYAARVRPADGTHSDLHAKALAIVDADRRRFVFLTIDAIGVPRTLRKNLEARLGQSLQLKPEEFVITASHTHSGPEFRPGRLPVNAGSLEPASQAYLRFLADTLQGLATEALRSLAPANLGYARARAGFAMNRRLPRPGSEPSNSPNPDGPVDHDVPVLRVEGADGKLRAIMFGYACHNTTLTQASYKYCADYAGYAREYLEAANPGVVALFLTGCGGDQNPYPRSTLEHAQQHGRALATAVEAALGTKARLLTGTLRSAYTEFDLMYAPAPTRAEYEAKLNAKDKQESLHARRMLDRLDREGSLPTRYLYPIQVLQLADLKIIALGGEAVVDYSLQLKQRLGGPNSVWMAAYSNDVLGYIPTEKILREGGYEGRTAMNLGIHPGPWAPGLEEKIITKTLELVQRTSTLEKPSAAK
ncbi:MAG TPA: neutral/alkaline non-lysosomal ceramidase N-terminal domain-containing protein [Opitutaceae bacterium]|nr:neutral/alkaline non-lysosomal ceramidase N-terminal domain-containing protein [Opitutaceae bacterium]